MAGYGARKLLSTGTHDPLYATVLVLKSDTESLAIVTADLHSLPLRSRSNPKPQKSSVSRMCCWPARTLTPDRSPPAPAAFGLQIPNLKFGDDDPWWRATEDKLIAAIGEAARTLAPARLGVGDGKRLHRPQSPPRASRRKGARCSGATRRKCPTSAVDPTITILRVDGADSKPRVILVNYSCHPTGARPG
jgi:hypothetical protein